MLHADWDRSNTKTKSMSDHQKLANLTVANGRIAILAARIIHAWASSARPSGTS